MNRRSNALACCSTLLLLISCSGRIEGPSPALLSEEEGESLATTIVCRDQLSTEVVVSGDGFSPIPVNIPNGPKVALPSITLSRTSELNGDPVDTPVDVLFSGTPDDRTNIKWLTWQSQKQMTFTVNQSLSVDGDSSVLPEGIHDILVRNPDDEKTQQTGVLAVVSKPVLEAPSPSITCLAQGARELTLNGATFLDIDGDLVGFEVAGEATPFVPSALRNCTKIARTGLNARTCESATVTLGKDSVATGYHRVNVHNPETAACRSEEEILLRVVPPPSISRVVPPLACVAESERMFTIEGKDYLEIDGALPSLTVGGTAFDVLTASGCKTLPTMGHSVRRCTELSFTVPQDGLPVGQPEVVVTNPDPAGCEASNAVALTIVPPPSIEEVVPDAICLDESMRSVEVNGEGFLEVDGVVPAVLVADVELLASAVSVSGCETIPVDGMKVRRCDTLRLSIPKNALDPTVADIWVTNPQPAGCSDLAPDALAILGAPEVLSAAPPLICTDDVERQLVLSGVDFVRVGDTFPTVTIDGRDVNVDAADGCRDVPVAGGGLQSCDTLTVTVPKGALSAGQNDVRVSNPEPVGCSGDAAVLTTPPTVTLTSAEPGNVCTTSGALSVSFTGTGFLRVDGNDFSVFVEGTEVVPTAITGCNSLEVAGMDVKSCTGFQIPFEPSGMSVGDVEVVVSNPAPSSCEVSASNVFRLVGPPTIAAVVPSNVCSDVSTTLALTGTGFVPGAMVLAGGVAADAVVVTSATSLEATWDSGLAAGTHDVTVNNDAGGTCATTVSRALVVDPTPLVFFVDPPVLYNGIQVGATIFTSGLSALAQSVDLVDSTGNSTPVVSFDSPDRPNRIQAEIPAGLVAGDYEVRVTSQLGCVGGLPGAVTVTDALTLDLSSIDPSYVSSTKDTAVTLAATSPPAADKVGFASTPRIYLDPTGSNTLATAMRAVVYQSGEQLSAVVPSGLAAGSYNVIVVNPNGEVGVLADGLTITATEPPLITAVVPSSLDNNADQPARIIGQNFDTVGVAVQLECRAPGQNTIATLAATVTSATATEVQATLPSSGLTADTVCIVRATNGDGAFFRYSAISAKSPAQNLGAWSGGASLTAGRRALSAVAARPTETSRFVYAIGGDDGTSASARSDVEAVSVDVFGDMGSFALQRSQLPAPRTLASAVTVGRFVYLTGGHDGTSATDTVLRAQVLDPLAGPEIVDLDAQLVDSEALPAGLWFYRVSATFPSADADNPGGESLPGEVFTVQLPDTGGGIELTLKWAQVTGASGYRVFRTAAPDGNVDNLELLGTVSCPSDAACDCGTDIACQLTDAGDATTASETPLPGGSLGIWHAAGTLASKREGHKTVAVDNPATPGEVFLYAFGGRDETGTLLDSYEYSTVSVLGNGEQSPGAWALSADTIGVPKADLAAWVVTNDDSNFVPAGQVQVFVGTGRTGTNTTTGEIFSGWVDTTNTSGELQATAGGSLDAENAAQQIAAAAFGDAGGYLFLFAGTRSSFTSTDSSTPVIAGPDLDNWNSLGGGSLATRRAYAAGVQESAFFFVLGGVDSGGSALTAVERTVQ